MDNTNYKHAETDTLDPNLDEGTKCRVRTNSGGMNHQAWASKVDYFLTLLGFSVGVGSMYKWPYLCMRNGGGAFLIPYTIITIIGTVPCVFLEMTIGQYSQSGAVKVWNFCPPLKGVGVGTAMIAWFFATYASARLGWFIYYFYYSFSTNIPWAHCGNEWNTPTCVSGDGVISQTGSNITDYTDLEMMTNSSVWSYTENANSSVMNGSAVPGLTAAEEFWRFKVLELTDSLQDIGALRGVLAGCLAITYILTYLCMFHGIKVSGKVVYATVTTPYILLTIFLVRGCLLPGAADGIYYYIFPNFEKLLDPEVWLEGSGYALYALGTAWGCVVTMAGHNKINNNCLSDAVLVTVIDSLSTLYCGFAFFAIMGHVAYLRGVTVEAFESSGYNLGFIAYPEAVASLPLPQLWSALTFVLFFTLGIDSLIPCFEVAVTATTEQFPSLSRWLVSFAVLLTSFLISLVYVTQGGLYVVTLVDWFAFFPSMLVFIFLECVIVSWIYGLDRLNDDIMAMWGKPLPRAIRISLKFICPIICLVLFSYSLYTYRPPKYDDYVYPSWAAVIGWIIAFSSIIPIPVIFMYTVYKTEGETLKKKLWNAMQPNEEWGHLRKHKRNEDDINLGSF